MTQAQADGTSLSVQLEAENRIPELVAGVVAGGGQIMRVTPRQHWLEEIYFRLQGGGS